MFATVSDLARKRSDIGVWDSFSRVVLRQALAD